MTTAEAQLNPRLSRNSEMMLGTTGGALLGGLMRGPWGLIEGWFLGGQMINSRWENATKHANEQIIKNNSLKALKNSEIAKNTAKKTGWVFRSACIGVASLIGYVLFDLNKIALCKIDQNASDCYKYSCLTTFSGISASVFFIISLYNYLT